MNTIKFTIEAKAYDSYIYAGNMYIIQTVILLCGLIMQIAIGVSAFNIG